MYTVNHERLINTIEYQKSFKKLLTSTRTCDIIKTTNSRDIFKAPEKSYSVLSEKVLLYIEN